MLEVGVRYGKVFIRPYERGDEEKILSLFKTVFGKEKSIEHWRWEFMDNPLGMQVMLAFINGELVAQCAGLPVKVRVGNRVFRAAQVVDCMSHPSYRGIAFAKKGVFALTVLEFFKIFGGCSKDAFVYGFPSERHYSLGEKLMGYKRITPIAEVVVPPGNRLVPRFVSGARVLGLGEVEDAIKATLEREEPFYRVGLLKDWEYVKWRYVGVPHKRYTFFWVRSGFKKGVAVVLDRGDSVALLDSFGVKPWDAADVLARCVGRCVVMWVPKKKVWLDRLPARTVVKEPEIKAVPCAVNLCEDEVSWRDLADSFFYLMGDSDLF